MLTHTHTHKQSTSYLLQVVCYLLTKGADPNLTLRPDVGSALCAVTTHTAHCRRTLPLSIQLVGTSPQTKSLSCNEIKFLQVHQLLTSGANLLMSVDVVRSDSRLHSGTVVDYAHETFKEVHDSNHGMLQLS